jgi:hypothetical protein|tara:strand:- start:620 stop:835 length:216 start_codon:yes stop_codon:yes gene_type:complete
MGVKTDLPGHFRYDIGEIRLIVRYEGLLVLVFVDWTYPVRYIANIVGKLKRNLLNRQNFATKRIYQQVFGY